MREKKKDRVTVFFVRANSNHRGLVLPPKCYPLLPFGNSPDVGSNVTPVFDPMLPLG